MLHTPPSTHTHTQPCNCKWRQRLPVMLRLSTTSATGPHTAVTNTHARAHVFEQIGPNQTRHGIESPHTHTQLSQVRKLTAKEQQAQLQPPAISHCCLVPRRRCRRLKLKIRGNTCTAHMRCTQRQVTQLKYVPLRLLDQFPHSPGFCA